MVGARFAVAERMVVSILRTHSGLKNLRWNTYPRILRDIELGFGAREK